MPFLSCTSILCVQKLFSKAAPADDSVKEKAEAFKQQGLSNPASLEFKTTWKNLIGHTLFTHISCRIAILHIASYSWAFLPTYSKEKKKSSAQQLASDPGSSPCFSGWRGAWVRGYSTATHLHIYNYTGSLWTPSHTTRPGAPLYMWKPAIPPDSCVQC